MFSKTAKRRTAPALDGTAVESAGLAARFQEVVRLRSRPAAALLFAAALGLTSYLLGTAPAPAADPNGDGIPGPPGLPDRNYEMVSPLDKNGGNVDADGRSSQSGDTIWYTAETAFADNPSNSFFNSYLADRQAQPWSTVGINAPMNPAFGTSPATVRGVSGDHGRVVVATNVELTPDAWPQSFFANQYGVPLYLRDQSDGSYELLTPEPVGGWTWEQPDLGTEQATPYPSLFDAGDGDFSHVLFETHAELTPDSTPLSNTAMKLYLYAGGGLALASVDQNGDPLPGSAGASNTFNPGEVHFPQELSDNGMISADGSRIFFTSPATGPGGGPGALYVNENGTSTLIDAAAVFRGATPSGSHVFFTSAGELKRYDVAAATTTVLSGDSEADDGSVPSVQGVLGFGADGETAYFVAGSQLIDGGPTGDPHYLYVWDHGTTKLLGAPTMNDIAWSLHLTAAQQERSVSADGSALLFRSNSTLTADDTGGFVQVYRFAADTSAPLAPDLACLSCPPPGTPATADASQFRSSTAISKPRRYLTDDASRAFFDSPDPLLPADTNGAVDVYMWEQGQLSLISTGRSEFQSVFVDVSPSGDDVFFRTFEPLVGWDQDDLGDLYDARIGGGFPEPPPPDPPCQGDACQESPSGAPRDPDAGTGAFTGPGNAPVAQPQQDCDRFRAKAKRLRKKATRKAKQGSEKRAKGLRKQVRKLSKKADRCEQGQGQ